MKEKMEQFQVIAMNMLGLTSIDMGHSIKSLDSLSRAELIVTAEEIFSIELTNAEILGLDRLPELISLIEEKVGDA